MSRKGNARDVKALVLTGFGINCENEMAAAFRLAGAQAEIAHLNDLFAGSLSIHDFDIVNFPGGFSFGDDLGSGKVLADKIRFKPMPGEKRLSDDLRDFVAEGNYILGICNGFQALVKAGILPNLGGSFEQEVTLATNDSGIFEDRWCRLKKNPKSASVFLEGIDVFPLPVRHGEGKLIIGSERIRRLILEKSLNCLSYCDANGILTSEYPLNPNGADLDCAALTDPSGRILGMMPHPEAFLSLFNHPDWPGMKRKNPDIPETGDGLKLFSNIVTHIRKEKSRKRDQP